MPNNNNNQREIIIASVSIAILNFELDSFCFVLRLIIRIELNCTDHGGDRKPSQKTRNRPDWNLANDGEYNYSPGQHNSDVRVELRINFHEQYKFYLLLQAENRPIYEHN